MAHATVESATATDFKSAGPWTTAALTAVFKRHTVRVSLLAAITALLALPMDIFTVGSSSLDRRVQVCAQELVRQTPLPSGPRTRTPALVTDTAMRAKMRRGFARASTDTRAQIARTNAPWTQAAENPAAALHEESAASTFRQARRTAAAGPCLLARRATFHVLLLEELPATGTVRATRRVVVVV